MSCEGCFTSARGQQEQYLSVKSEAQNYANEKKYSVALWKEQFEWYYLEASAAITSGKPISEILTPTID